MALVGNNEMASILGMKAPAFAKGVRQGRFTPSKYDKNKKPLYDPVLVKKQFNATKATADMQDGASLLPNELKGGRPSMSDNSEFDNISRGKVTETFLKAKAAKEASTAHLLRLKYELANGKLIEKDIVKKRGAEFAAEMMGVIDAWASRLAPELAAMKNADEHDFYQKMSHESNLLKQQIIKKCG